jgi:hypothetical protein
LIGQTTTDSYIEAQRQLSTDLEKYGVGEVAKGGLTSERKADITPGYFCFFLVWNFGTFNRILTFSPTEKTEMTSRSFSEGAFIDSQSSTEDSIKDKSLNYRHPTVYDAVAGNYYLSSNYRLAG